MLDKYSNRIPPVAATKETMVEISNVYNYRLKQERVHFEIEWEKIYEKRKMENLRYVNPDKK